MFNETQELADYKTHLSKIIDFTRQDLQSLRTGKAAPSIIEGMTVEAYGGTTRLRMQELATVMTDGPQGLLISPFDPSTVQDIEKAILASPLHLTPAVEGKNIRIKIPPLTEDQRKQIAKLVNQKIEEGKNKLRNSRDELRKKLKQEFENKSVSEDQRFRVEKEIDKITLENSQLLDEIREKKETEIMNV